MKAIIKLRDGILFWMPSLINVTGIDKLLCKKKGIHPSFICA